MGQFVDCVTITAKAGNGGNGSASFHREKFVMNGGPDGGDGGDGGNVVFLADANMHTLLDFRFRGKYTAENGEDGRSNRCMGKRGQDLIVKVPVGTLIRDKATGKILADMDVSGESRILLKGGKGGWGNTHFATATKQAPNFARPGGKSPVRELILELKTIADVGLVGYPNVGKSSMLSILTSAKPKIGNYHFTTLTPNLGIFRRYGKDIVIADIPGLIEGAASGAGLGHDFLRHIERTRLLLHVLDASGTEGRDPVEDFQRINAELGQYGNLKNIPQMIVCNKMDLPGAAENADRIRNFASESGIPVFEVSAATRSGFDLLMDETARVLDTLPPVLHYEAEEDAGEVPEEEPFRIRKDGMVYVLEGTRIENLLESVNLDDLDSLNWFHRTLIRMGVIDALKSAGAGEGDSVRIGETEFDFVE